MPHIRTYQEHVGAPDPGFVEKQAHGGSGDAFAQAGKFATQFGAQVTQWEEQDETSQLAAKMADAQAKLTIREKELAINTNPNDYPKVAKDFMDNEVASTLDAIGADLQTSAGRDMYTRMRANVSSNFLMQTAAQGSEMAGQAAINNFISAKTNLTSSVLQNPAAIGGNKLLFDVMVDRMQGVPVAKREELRQAGHKELAIAQITGIANNNPAAARQLLDSKTHNDVLDAGDQIALRNQIDGMERTQLAEQKALQAEQVRQNKAAVDEKSVQIMSSVMQPDGSLHAPPEAFRSAFDLGLMPNADPAEVRALHGFLKGIQDDEINGTKVVSDPHLFEDFSARMFLGKEDKNALSAEEVYNARAARKLSDKDFTFFRSGIIENARDPARAQRDRQFNQMVGGMKGYITKSNPFLGLVNPAQDQKYYEFNRDARVIYDNGVKAGKSLVDIEKSVIDIIPRYQTDRKGAMKNIQSFTGEGLSPSAPVGSGAPARQPGESAAAYLKRTGGG